MRILYSLVLAVAVTAAFATQPRDHSDISQTEYDFAYKAPAGVVSGN